jgi:hypothetical protein
LSKTSHAVLPVTQLPEVMQLRFAQLAADEGLALRASVTIARFRKKHRQGPTFAELFESLVETGSVQIADWPTDSRSTYAFRHHLAVHWRRAGWITWSHRERSLATGVRFREASWAHSQRNVMRNR